MNKVLDQRTKRINEWKLDPNKIDSAQLLAMVKDIGKGRLSGKLKRKYLVRNLYKFLNIFRMQLSIW